MRFAAPEIALVVTTTKKTVFFKKYVFEKVALVKYATVE